MEPTPLLGWHSQGAVVQTVVKNNFHDMYDNRSPLLQFLHLALATTHNLLQVLSFW